jgi:hypothetical protein
MNLNSDRNLKSNGRVRLDLIRFWDSRSQTDQTFINHVFPYEVPFTRFKMH